MFLKLWSAVSVATLWLAIPQYSIAQSYGVPEGLDAQVEACTENRDIVACLAAKPALERRGRSDTNLRQRAAVYRMLCHDNSSRPTLDDSCIQLADFHRDGLVRTGFLHHRAGAPSAEYLYGRICMFDRTHRACMERAHYLVSGHEYMRPDLKAAYDIYQRFCIMGNDEACERMERYAIGSRAPN